MALKEQQCTCKRLLLCVYFARFEEREGGGGGGGELAGNLWVLGPGL